MLTAYTVENHVLQQRQITRAEQLTQDIRWLDVHDPTDQERQWIRLAYRQELQFIEELGEIEASARHYQDEHGLHLHLYFLHDTDTVARNSDVAFTINAGRLYTLHAEQVSEFRSYYTHAHEHPELRDEAMCIMLGIVSTRLGLLADAYERLQTELETLGQAIFRNDDSDMPRVLQNLARVEDTNSKARLGLMEHQRVFSGVLRGPEDVGEHASEINEILRDVESLVTHSNFLFDRTKFMMDTAMGMINLGHSRRLSVFTVVSVVLMPPMLVTGIYGMNFRHMPELEWLTGYPLALALIAALAVGPIFYLQRKKWL